MGVSGNEREAFIWYRKSAALDYPDALDHIRAEAEKGNATAQNCYGLMHALGQAVEKDYEEAVKWYSLAAEQDNRDAQYNLCVMYDGGLGAKKDIEKASALCQKAAEKGSEDAQKRLEQISSRRKQ